MSKTMITITARDLDTDDRSTVEVEAEAPLEAADQRTGLIAAVREHHPAARIRSFADGAATFIDRQHLVVAAYTGKQSKPEAPDLQRGQSSLFDAAA